MEQTFVFCIWYNFGMKYVALLRGINVGGNSIIRMADLKRAFEECGFTNVVTYINSGNVIFESEEKSIKAITDLLEKELSETFNFNLRLVVITHAQLQEVVRDAPSEWKKDSDLRRYISFIKEPVTAKDAVQEPELKDGVDFVKDGKQVLYLSTKLEGLTKSNFTKLMGKKIYQDMTMRNFNTVQKLLALMEKS